MDSSKHCKNYEDMITHYKVVNNIIGCGTYGIVRKCIKRKTNGAFAVKTIAKTQKLKVDRLRTEVSILRSVSHPNIVKLEEVFEDGSCIHLVMTLCTGGELYSCMIRKFQSKEKVFCEQEAANLAKKMYGAVAYCHSHNIAHRDLKPENFIFESENPNAEIKLIDFGLSKCTDLLDPWMHSRVGTMYYTAPEVYECKYTNKCDVWSIGVILYTLLSGYYPFHAETEIQMFQTIKQQDLFFPESEWDVISPEAKDFLRTVLSKSEVGRPTAQHALDHPWLHKSAEKGEICGATSIKPHKSIPQLLSTRKSLRQKNFDKTDESHSDFWQVCCLFDKQLQLVSK